MAGQTKKKSAKQVATSSTAKSSSTSRAGKSRKVPNTRSDGEEQPTAVESQTNEGAVVRGLQGAVRGDDSIASQEETDGGNADSDADTDSQPAELELTLQKILNIFGSSVTRTAVIKAEAEGAIPKAKRTGKIGTRVWTYDDLPYFGQRYGFLVQKTEDSYVVTFFSTKGGIYKSTLAMNFARLVALHMIPTIVIGLDMQCDITGDMGFGADLSEDDSLEVALAKLGTVYGLEDFCKGRLSLDAIIEKSDIPTLDFIPETPALTQLDRDIGGMDFKEHWLNNEVITPLKKRYKLIVLDCSPNWNNLITNALMASDLIVSPLECKIKHFRNFPYFKVHMENFFAKSKLNTKHFYVATKLQNKKLSKDIKKWYLSKIPNIFSTVIRESARAEEASAKRLSFPEHVPTDIVSQEMREFVSEIWEQLTAPSVVKASIPDRTLLTETSTSVEA